jgi:hypothetical protein
MTGMLSNPAIAVRIREMRFSMPPAIRFHAAL